MSKRPHAEMMGGSRKGYGVQRSGGSASQKLTTNDALTYLRDVKEKFKDDKGVYDNFLEIMKQFKAQTIDTNGVIREVKSLFKGHRELILGFNTFLPKGFEIQLAEEDGDARPKQPVEFDQAICYVNKIKNRFAGNERVYKSFLEILNMYRKEEKTIEKVYEEVEQLFKHHPDLLEEFTNFLPDSSMPSQRGQKRAQGGRGAQPAKDDGDFEPRTKASALAKELQFFERVKARLRNRDVFNEFLKCLHIFNQDIITKMELKGLVYDVLGKYPDLHSGFDDFLQRCESMDLEAMEAGRGQSGKMNPKDMAKMKIIAAREKFISRPISELDLSACERCGPSYRLLPKNFPKAAASGRSDLARSVLNDDWVSVTSGSEDFSFKAMRKNQYEESLFRCEDDRFEMDMIIETNASVLTLLQDVQNKIAASSAEERASFKIPEGTLSAVHLRSVERIYGAEHGQEFREQLQRNPAVAIPVVLARLRQKDDEWRRCRKDAQKVWADVYEKNIYKSLDHRSFYFKQADKKSLSTKGMLAEIRELSDKRRLAEEGPFVSPSRRGTVLALDMKFDVSDRAVHDDAYSIVKYSTGEMMTADHAQKLLNFWVKFFEPFFGVRRAGAEGGGFVDNAAELAAAAIQEESKADEKAAKEEKDQRAAAGGAGAGAGEGGEGKEGADGEQKGDGKEEETKAEKAAAGGLEEMAEAGADDDEGDDDDDNDDDEDKMDEDDEVAFDISTDRLFASCKPLASAVPGVETDGDSPMSARSGQVFYANDKFFLLFRLHMFLYERLAAARRSAEAMGRQAGEDPTQIHATFLRLLFKLLSGGIDATKYEDECRTLLGANSYVLFTIDKLVYKLVKQLQHVANDAAAMKLWQLHIYESARQLAPYRDSVYLSNACVLLHDELCFRIVAPHPPGSSLGFQLLDGGSDARVDVCSGMVEADFSDYLKTFMQTPAPEGTKGVFLKRNAKLSPARAYPEALSKVTFYNGLECKLNCSSSKVSYVLDTEDVLFRPHKRSAGAAAKKALGRFKQWHQRAFDKIGAAAAAQ